MTNAVSIEFLLLIAGLLLFLSILANKASGRLGVPTLVLFLGVGMLAGADGPGGIYFDNPWIAQALGVIALVFILYSGGLDTDWAQVRPVLGPGLVLATLGVFITAGSVALFATLVLDLSLLNGLLLGAIISSTDAAAIFSVLRTQSVRIKQPLEPLLELESGSNDPMAVFLTLGTIHLLIAPDPSPGGLVLDFLLQMGLGAALGYAGGRASVWLINRIRLQVGGLYMPLTIALVLLIFSATSEVGGNGFLAVYLSGIVMGREDFVHKRSIRRFHDGLAWLVQIAMFITLGLLVFPSRLPAVAIPALLTASFLILVARPLAVIVSLAPFRFPWRDKLFISWVGLRGAVPIVLATFPRLAGVPGGEILFDVVFFAVLTSVLIQGTTIPQVARLLRLEVKTTGQPAPAVEVLERTPLSSQLTELEISPASRASGRQILDLHLPPHVLIILIGRDADFFIPTGATVLQPGDRLLVLSDQAALHSILALIDALPPEPVPAESKPNTS